jgi:hypothetical protein
MKFIMTHVPSSVSSKTSSTDPPPPHIPLHDPTATHIRSPRENIKKKQLYLYFIAFAAAATMAVFCI